MNRVNPVRSQSHCQHHMLQMVSLALSLTLMTDPALSLPVSHSALDLLETAQTPGVISARDTAGVSSQELTSTPIEPLSAQPATSKSGTKPLQGADAASPSIAQSLSNPQAQTPVAPLDLDPTLIESSPVLQRWLKQVPDVLADIKRDPSFRTRVRLVYSQFPSTKQAGGLNVGIEDVFVGRSGLTLSANYETAFNGSRESWGGNLRYYVRPLGSVVNLAPVIGYRHLATTRYAIDGVHVGLRLLLVPSRTGAADIAITQSWVAPGDEAEVGLTTLSFGYALTHNLRLSTNLQKQNSRFRSDSQVGIGLEWMF